MKVFGGERKQDVQGCGKQREEASSIGFHESTSVISDSESCVHF
jgi:hypothetical protein